MPFPTDEQLMKRASSLVEGCQSLFGKHPGFRPAHAKSQLLKSTFTPTGEAAKLSSAARLQPPVPVLLRFSASTGLPSIPDTAQGSLPHGMAVRFELPDTPEGCRSHTDIISHSTPSFPTRASEEFLEMLQAIIKSQWETEHPDSIGKYIATHPAAAAHVQRPKPPVQSYAGDVYCGVNAFRFISKDWKVSNIRFRLVSKL